MAQPVGEQQVALLLGQSGDPAQDGVDGRPAVAVRLTRSVDVGAGIDAHRAAGIDLQDALMRRLTDEQVARPVPGDRGGRVQLGVGRRSYHAPRAAPRYRRRLPAAVALDPVVARVGDVDRPARLDQDVGRPAEG